MPNIKEISSYQPPQKTTPVFFFLDICYPSDEARKAQKKVVNSILMSLNAFAGTGNYRSQSVSCKSENI